MRRLRSFPRLLCGALLYVAPADAFGQAEPPVSLPATEQVYLLIRSDDAGMSHSVNMALQKLGAVLDMNTDQPLLDMSRNRQGELDALTSQRFRDALKVRNIQLVTYRQLIEMQGLAARKRPGT